MMTISLIKTLSQYLLWTILCLMVFKWFYSPSSELSQISSSQDDADRRNFTDSKRPRLLNSFDGQETQHVCLGGEDELRAFGPLTRHCVFKNMCLNVSSQQWLYYSGNK